MQDTTAKRQVSRCPGGYQHVLAALSASGRVALSTHRTAFSDLSAVCWNFHFIDTSNMSCYTSKASANTCLRPGLIVLSILLLSATLLMLSSTQCSLARSATLFTRDTASGQLNQGVQPEFVCGAQPAPSSGQLAVLQHPKVAGLTTKPYIELLPGLDPSNRESAQPDMRIPRIIHQHYNKGIHAFRQAYAKAATPYRQWVESCKVHHPGWTYILWDEDSSEALIKQHYPQFLETWNLLRHGNNGSHPIVRTGDFVRPIFLHALGGVYLDNDVECFADMTPWLLGADLVLQEQQKGGPAGYGLLNGQMASTAGNAFWLRTAEVLRDNTTQRVKASKLAEPLYGLWAVNTAFEGIANHTDPDRSGWYDLTAKNAGHLLVYDFHQWLYLCRWHGASDGCEATEAGQPPGYHRRAAAASVPVVLAGKADKQNGLKGVYALAGAQHYTASWTEESREAGHMQTREKAENSIMEFFRSGANFSEHTCKTLTVLGASTPQSGGTLSQKHQVPVPICWEDVAAAAAKDEGCTVVLVHTSSSHGASLGRRSPTQDYPPLEASMAAAGCKVVLVAPVKIPQSAHSVQSVYGLLGTLDDPAADPPLISLSSLLCTNIGRVTVLLLPAQIAQSGRSNPPTADKVTAAEFPDISAFELLADLYAEESEALSPVDTIVLSKPAQPSDGRTAYAAYHHLYSQHGFVGFWWSDHAMAFTRPISRRW